MLSLLRYPLKPVAHVLHLGSGHHRRRMERSEENTIPVAGIDNDVAHSILFTLKEAVSLTDSDSDLADLWLEAFVLCQLASSSLITQLRQVDETLRFWRDRNRQGAGLFFLVRRGPVHFFRGLLAPILNLVGLQPFGKRLPAHERMERRIVTLQRLRSKLLQSLALVHARAALLLSTPSPSSSSSSAAPDGPRQRWSRAVRSVVIINRKSRLAQQTGPAPSTSTPAPVPPSEQGPAQASADSAMDSPSGQAPAHLSLPRNFASSGAAEVIGAARHLLKARAIVREATRAVEGCCEALAVDLEGLRKDVNQILQSEEQEVNAFTTGAATPQTAGSAADGGPSQAAAAGSRSPTADAAAAVERLRRALNAEYLASGRKNVNAYAALREAQAGVKKAKLDLPGWLAMPPQLQQKWVETCLGAGVAFAAVRFLYKHSRLAGSSDLEDWANTATRTVKAQWKERVLEPLAVIRGELTSTFRKKESIVTESDLDLSKLSLMRMLKEFEDDHAKRTGTHVPPRAPSSSGSTSSTTTTAAASPSPSAAATTGATAQGNASTADVSVTGGLVDSLVSYLPESLGGAPAAEEGAAHVPSPSRSLPEDVSEEELLRRMALLMSVYERELRHPLRNAVGGNLARAMLIQVQKLKVDTESAMLELEKILRANELTIAMTAALPALLLLGALGGLTLRLLLPGARKPVQGSGLAIACRLSLSDLEKGIELTANPRGGLGAVGSAPGLYLPASTSLSGRSEGATGRAMAPEVLEAGGLVLYRIAVLRNHLEKVYKGFHRLAVTREMRDEWPSLEQDLNELITTTHAGQRRRIIERMGRTYTVFMTR